MKDLYELILERSKKELEYKELATLLKDIAIGGDSFLFGGHSSIKAESRCVCLDTFSLQNASDNVKKTQYFNLPQSLVFLRDVAKRARKYEAGLAIVSHSVVVLRNM